MSRWLLVVLLAGCAPVVWTKPDATPERAQLDANDCRQRAWREAQWRAFSYPGYRRSWRGPFGYDPFFDETYLTRFCMEVRGYRLEAAGAR